MIQAEKLFYGFEEQLELLVAELVQLDLPEGQHFRFPTGLHSTLIGRVLPILDRAVGGSRRDRPGRRSGATASARSAPRPMDKAGAARAILEFWFWLAREGESFFLR